MTVRVNWPRHGRCRPLLGKVDKNKKGRIKKAAQAATDAD